PSATDPPSPMNVRAGGALTARNGSVAAASAKYADAGAPMRSAANPYAPKPQIAITAASPSLPSMKLNRFADQTIASVTAIADSATRSPHPSPAGKRAMATATANAATM